MHLKIKYLSMIITLLLLLISLSSEAETKPKISIKKTNADEVGLYEKFEIIMDLNASYLNPFDPDDVNLRAVFTSPSGKIWEIWGFYNISQWDAEWNIRFSPNEIGKWSYVVKVTDSEGTEQSNIRTFTAIASPHHGMIKVSPKNNRYLMYDDGTSFYGIGLWHNDNYHLYNRGTITEENLDYLKKYGVNIISFFISPLETMGTGVGRYDQNRCGRLDEILEWCETRGIQIAFNIWFHSYLSETIWGGGNSRWNNNPYKLICECKDFYGNTKAWEYQEKLYRYIIARWGYSRSLAIWFVVDEITGTDGWVHGSSITAEEWCSKVHNYLKKNDPFNRPTTGTQHGEAKCYWQNGYKIFDLAAREIYERQGFPIPEGGKIALVGDNPLQFSYLNYVGETQKLWNEFKKPVIIGETGWDHTFYEPGMPGYLATYHNVLWACLANGLAMTPLWWAYSDRINESVVTSSLRNFSRFVSNIEFANLDITPLSVTTDNCDAYGMKSEKIIFGWIVNSKGDVAGKTFTISGLPDGMYNIELYHTWRGRIIQTDKVTCVGGKLSETIPELIGKGSASYIGSDIAFKIVPIADSIKPGK